MDVENANQTVRELQKALRSHEATIAKHEEDQKSMQLRIDHLTACKVRMERIYIEREDLSGALRIQKMHNVALKEELDRLRFELDTMANAQSFYVEKSIQPCSKCLLHQLQQVKPGETD